MSLADNTRFAIGPNSSLNITNTLNAANKTITKAGGGALVVPNVRAAGLIISDGVVATSNGTSQVQTLSISGGTTPTAALDLADNDLIVGDSTARATIEAQIAFARNGGAWDRAGITSSAADANPLNSTTLGVLSGGEYSSAGGNGTFNGLS
jgi:hypothetical protein